MAEPHDPPEPSSNPLIPTPIIGRNVPPSDRPTLPPDIEEQFNRLAQTVQVLSAHFLGESAAADLETAKERGARRVRKFHRASGDGPTAENPAEAVGDPVLGESETPESLARNQHIAWPRQGVPGATLPSGWQLLPETRFRLGMLALGLVVLALGFLIGHAASSPAKAGQATPKASALFDSTELNEQAFLTVNEALHDERGGKPDAARKLYEAAVGRHADLPGMNYRLALLAMQRNDLLEAQQRLERSALDGEAVAECSYVLARIAADRGDFEEAALQFERGTRAQPYDGRYFFYHGEILRRQGKPQAAVAAFEQALDRPYTVDDGDLYLFKERLAKVEDGRDDAFNAELATRLTQEPLGGDWLLLAAAHDLDHRSFKAAADHLRQAENRLPSATYAELTHDYVFQAQAKEPELTGLLSRTANPVVSSAGPAVLDPATWPPGRADPATWPVASGRSATH